MGITITPALKLLFQMTLDTAITKLFLELEGKSEEEIDRMAAEKEAEKKELDGRLAGH